jgi:hypothetical protein
MNRVDALESMDKAGALQSVDPSLRAREREEWKIRVDWQHAYAACFYGWTISSSRSTFRTYPRVRHHFLLNVQSASSKR